MHACMPTYIRETRKEGVLGGEGKGREKRDKEEKEREGIGEGRGGDRRREKGG